MPMSINSLYFYDTLHPKNTGHSVPGGGK